MKNDNRINIGSKNKIENSIIGNNINTKDTRNDAIEKMSLTSKLLWRIIIPITVAVVSALLVWILGLN